MTASSRKFSALLLNSAVALMFFACGTQAQPPAANNDNNKAAALARQDRLWSRRRECAAAVDAAIRHAGWDKSVDQMRLTGSSSHYNESLDRCFVQIDIINNGYNKAAGIPLSSYVVLDAFDVGSVACSDDPNTDKNLCYVFEVGKEGYFGCDNCRMVAKQWMSR